MYGDDKILPPSLVAAVVAALGDGWSEEFPEDNRYMAHLRGPNNADLWLTRSWDLKGKLHISGHYPPNQAGGLKIPSINVGETRGAGMIAKEIARRLLPDYLPELERVAADNERRAANRERRQLLAKELAGMVGGRIDTDRHGSETSVAMPYQSGGPWGEFHIDAAAGSGRVELRSLTVDQLRAIAAVLGK